jgi:hypothetical protein
MSQSPFTRSKKKKKENGDYLADSISHKKRKRIVSMPRRATWFYARNVMEGGWGRFQHEKKKLKKGGG